MKRATAGRSELNRARTLSDIDAAALDLLGRHGPEGLSMSALGRAVGLSTPSLYHYVDGRNGVLTSLVEGSYVALAEAVDQATEAAADAPVEDRLRAQAAALRSWALANRHRYRLLYGPPIPAYQAPDDVTETARRPLRAMASVIDELRNVRPAETGPGARLEAALTLASGAPGLGVSAPGLRWALVAWTRLHGVLSLELEGHLGALLPDATVLFDAEVDAIVKEALLQR